MVLILPQLQFSSTILRPSARARDAGADLGPDGNQGLDRMGQRAGVAQMFVTLADLLAWQEEHRAFCRQGIGHRGERLARSLANPKMGETARVIA